jgi:hypothetical protein
MNHCRKCEYICEAALDLFFSRKKGKKGKKKKRCLDNDISS